MLTDTKKILPICFELLLFMPRACKKLEASWPMAYRSFIVAFCLFPLTFWTLQVHPLLFAAGETQPSTALIVFASLLANVTSTILLFVLVYFFVRSFSLLSEFPRFVVQMNWLAFIFAIWVFVVHLFEYMGVIDFQFTEDIFVVTKIYAAIVLAVCFYGTFRMDWVWGAFFAAISIILGDAVQDLFYAMIDVHIIDYAEYFKETTASEN